MVYTKGNLIEIGDFNTFVGEPTGAPADANKTLQPFIDNTEATLKVAAIYGVGYGQRGYGQTDIDLPNKLVSELVESADWTTLRTAIFNAATHQGTATTLLPPANVLEIGDVVVAHDGVTDVYNLPLMISNIDNVANRFNVASASTTAGGVATRGSTWGTSIVVTMTATFLSEDAARYFFNSGGKLRIDLDHPAGGAQDNAWNTILNNYVGIVDMNYTQTTRTGSKGTPAVIGYYDLTGSYQVIYNGTDVGDAPYTVNDVLIEAKANGIAGVNGGNGTSVDIKITLSDQHTGPADTVSAGTTSTPITVKTTNLTITSPSWSNSGWSGS